MAKIRFKSREEAAAEQHENWRQQAVVSAFQARALLARQGKLGEVTAAIRRRRPDSEQAIAWEYATHIPRYHPLLLEFAQEEGYTDEQLDAFFEAAMQIDDGRRPHERPTPRNPPSQKP